MDPDEYRRASLDRWERAAGGWATQRERFQAAALPVSRWMVDAIEPQPGQQVLELAAGPGDTGFLAAERIAPGGTLLCSDAAEPMLEAARARADGLGVTNVEFRVLDAEWIDLPAASQDAVLCRWGYMLLADPGAALRETRRVLRPGGRLALAAWDAPERNPGPWAAAAVADEQGLTPGQDPDAPGMFAFAAPGRIESELAGAGFADWRVEAVDLVIEYPSVQAWWEAVLDFARPFADLVESLEPRQLEALRAGFDERIEPFAGEDGALRIPGRTLVATASA